MTEKSQSPSDKKQDFVSVDKDALDAGAVGGILFYGVIFGEVLRGVLKKSYSRYRQNSEGPTTVWRWLGEGAKKKVGAIKNWDPDV